MKIKVTRIGNSLGLILPKEVVSALKVEQGDTLSLSEAPGGFRITPYDLEVERQLEAGREFSKEYRDTLRALAN
jgi:putative addiction module antidote